VRELGLTNPTNFEIWEFALKNKYTIVTFDSDVIDLANLIGSPPKIIWLRFGKASNLKIVNKALSNMELILTFIKKQNLIL
jgi:predicted nuclease of predicted toxin-antitoxin system